MPVDALLTSMGSKELSQWMAYFAVRKDRRKDEEDDDGETYHWGSPRDEGDEE